MGGGVRPEHLLCVLPFDKPTANLDRIKKENPGIEITYVDVRTDTLGHGLPDEIWRDATILVTISALPRSPSLCPNLELIHVLASGLNHISTHPLYTSTTIPITNSAGIHGPPIAEWIFMTATLLSHHYPLLSALQHAHHWPSPLPAPLRSIRDSYTQRIGILGYGAIGRHVARVAHAMGMTVLAYTAHPRPTRESRRHRGFVLPETGDVEGRLPSEWWSGRDRASLRAFLERGIDHLVVCVPLTGETRGLVGAGELEILGRRSGALVTNVSRGEVLDQEALGRELRRWVEGEGGGEGGRKRMGLRGAALDVTDPEPLPPDHPLWDAPNCIITPHISSATVAYAERAFQILEVNLRRKREGKGEEYVNLVDRRRGY